MYLSLLVLSRAMSCWYVAPILVQFESIFVCSVPILKVQKLAGSSGARWPACGSCYAWAETFGFRCLRLCMPSYLRIILEHNVKPKMKNNQLFVYNVQLFVDTMSAVYWHFDSCLLTLCQLIVYILPLSFFSLLKLDYNCDGLLLSTALAVGMDAPRWVKPSNLLKV